MSTRIRHLNGSKVIRMSVSCYYDRYLFLSVGDLTILFAGMRWRVLAGLESTGLCIFVDNL